MWRSNPVGSLYMKKAFGILSGLCLLSLAGVPANAATFTLSDAFGSGNFGTATFVDLGAQPGSTDTIRVTFEMAPNLIVDTGSHFSATFSLLGNGRVDATNLDSLNGGSPPNFFDTNTHLAIAGYSNSPFGDFTDAITGNCGSGSSSGGCGTKLVFDVLNFQGFGAATNAFDPPPAGGPTFPIFAAVDIFNAACAAAGGRDCTGVVALTAAPTPQQEEGPQTPIPGAVWLFGTVLAGGASYGRWRKKRKA